MSLNKKYLTKNAFNATSISTLQPPIRVLVIEDDEQDFFLISELVREIQDKEFVIDWCYDFDKALEHIYQSKYDIYFVDYLLGEKTGLELLKEARKHFCEEPIVVLTGLNRKDVDMQAMKEGAVDYLIKSELSTEKIERCIRYALERNAYLKALRANERKFYSVFEKSKDAIFLADETLSFKVCNHAMTELFKYSGEELKNMSLYALFAQKKSENIVENELKKNGETENMEILMIAKTGVRRNCLLTLSLETNEKNEPYVQGIIHDITNLKKIEKAKLQIEKLKSSEFFLRSLAHEVRNPISNIYLSLDEIKPVLANAHAEEFSEIIYRNLNRINVLVSQLLDSATLGEIEESKISLQTILDNAIVLASDRISLKKTNLQVSYPDQSAYIIGDAEKLKTAFLNIVINAVEAVKENSGKIWVSIVQENSCHKVIIRDNGIGISEENLQRIFEPYYTSKANGFGLGLAATLNILQSHKAYTDVQSNLGEGTTFSLLFEQA
ncbi:MAG TPA: ATP-binding protein [Puia sp.]|jgi:PAS domain S-box-containing protein|nr:ATP-binding protein [Puia sp.]